MINKELVKRRFAAHYDTYNNHAKAQEHICKRLAHHLTELNFNPKRGLEIGAGTGFMTEHLLSLFPNCNWLLNDISEDTQPYLDQVCNNDKDRVSYLFEDAELIDLSGSFDMVASASTIQWFNDFEKFLRGVEINHGGYIAVTTFTPNNFNELVYSTQSKGLHYNSEQHYLDLFSNYGYRKVVMESYDMEMTFSSPVEVLRHLRYTGVNAIESVVWSREKLDSFINRYQQKYPTKEGVKLTYSPLIMIFQKI